MTGFISLASPFILTVGRLHLSKHLIANLLDEVAVLVAFLYCRWITRDLPGFEINSLSPLAHFISI